MRGLLLVAVLAFLLLSGCIGGSGKRGLELALSESAPDAEIVAFFNADKLLGNGYAVAKIGLDNESAGMARLFVDDAFVAVMPDGSFAYSIGIKAGDLPLVGAAFMPHVLKRIDNRTDTNFTAREYAGQNLYSNGKLAYFVSGRRAYVGVEKAVMGMADAKAGGKNAWGAYADIAKSVPLDSDFSAVVAGGEEGLSALHEGIGLGGYLDGKVSDTFVVVKANDALAAQLIFAGLGSQLGGGIAVESVEVDRNFVYARMGIDITRLDPSAFEIGVPEAGLPDGVSGLPSGAGLPDGAELPEGIEIPEGASIDDIPPEYWDGGGLPDLPP